MVALALVSALRARPMTQANADVRLQVIPEVPYLEEVDGDLRLHLDLVIHNPGATALEITRIEVRVRTETRDLVQRKFLDERNGTGLRALPERHVAAGQVLTVYNPFYRFEPWRRLAELEFAVTLRDVDGRIIEPPAVRVRPVRYEQQVDLVLPTAGPAMVWDGHDFYSHHRRQDVGRMLAQIPDLPDNPVRFAYDFSTVNERGELHRGNPDRIHEWYAYGSPVRAPGSGVVVSAANHIPDNQIVNGELVYAEGLTPEDAILGNHVIIEHGDGEFSALAHLQAGSLSVEVGDSVDAGQEVGRIGFSGDSGLHVHMHYQLMNGTSLFAARSLPSYFRNFQRLLGDEVRSVDRGTVDTGEIVADESEGF